MRVLSETDTSTLRDRPPLAAALLTVSWRQAPVPVTVDVQDRRRVEPEYSRMRSVIVRPDGARTHVDAR